VPKLRIEEPPPKPKGADRPGKQRDRRQQKYKPVDEAPIVLLKVENSTVRRRRSKAEAAAVRARSEEVDQALAALTAAPAKATAPVALAIDAARAKATVAKFPPMEKVFGRHRAEIKSITASTRERPPCPIG